MMKTRPLGRLDFGLANILTIANFQDKDLKTQQGIEILMPPITDKF
jgi:hypothetical protein